MLLLKNKTIYLLRHATAVSSSDGGDTSRPLSSIGAEDAELLGQYMKVQDMNPDYVLCSTARRTRETLQGLEKSLSFKKTEFSDILYNGDMEDYLDALQAVNDNYCSVLIIAHNPVIYQLALALACGVSPDSLQYGYAPATLSVFQAQVNCWSEIKTGENAFKSLFTSTNRLDQTRPTQWM